MSSTFTIEVQELRRPENRYFLHVRWSTSVKDIKDMLHKTTKTPPSEQDIFHATSTTPSKAATPLRNQVRMHDLGIDGNDHVFRMAIKSSKPSAQSSLSLLPGVFSDPETVQQIDDVKGGLERNLGPGKTDLFDCTGGVYFMKNSREEKVAVFKPCDEEQGMPYNNKGHDIYSLRPHFQPGQGYLREFAAYILDENSFSGVPPTTLVHCEHPSFNYKTLKSQAFSESVFPKVGSLQKFVTTGGDTFDDIGHSKFTDFEVQKIALLDLRLLNSDRNGSNILVRRRARVEDSLDGHDDSRSGSPAEDMIFFDDYDMKHMDRKSGPDEQLELVPIDHGYCLPTRLLIQDWDLAWINTPQVDVEVHPRIKAYINCLDIEKLIANLTSQIPVSADCIFLLRIAHKLIHDGVAAGLTLKDIALIVVRSPDDDEAPSTMEKIISEAEENAYRTIEMRSGINSHSSAAMAHKNKQARLSPTFAFRPHDIPRGDSIDDDSSDCCSPERPRRSKLQVVPPTSSTLSDSDPQTSPPGGDADGEGSGRSFDSRTSRSDSVSSSDDDRFPCVMLPMKDRAREERTCSSKAAFSMATVSRSGSDREAKSHSALSKEPIQKLGSAFTSTDVAVGRPKSDPANYIGGLALAGESLRTLRSVDGAGMRKPLSPQSKFSGLSSQLRAINESVGVVDAASAKVSIRNIPEVDRHEGRPLRRTATVTSSDLGGLISESVVGNMSAPSSEKKRCRASRGATLDAAGDEAPRGEEELELTTVFPPAKDAAVNDDIDGASLGMPLDTLQDVDEIFSAKGANLGAIQTAPSKASDSYDLEVVVGDDAGTDGDTDAEVDVGKPAKAPQLPKQQAMTNSQAPLLPPVALMRVTSFAGFSSPPIYDTALSERRLAKMQREQRRSIAVSQEFSRLRLLFASESVAKIISKEAKKKRSGSL